MGVDAEIAYTRAASIVFQVLGDGRVLFNSGVMRSDTPAKRVSVDLGGVGELKLVVTDAGDGSNSDHADWAEPILLCKPEPAEADKPVKYTVKSPTLALGLNEDGDICRITAGKFSQSVHGGVWLAGCHIEGKAAVEKLGMGEISVSRKLTHSKDHTCTVTERFTPTDGRCPLRDANLRRRVALDDRRHHPIDLPQAEGAPLLDGMVQSRSTVATCGAIRWP